MKAFGQDNRQMSQTTNNSKNKMSGTLNAGIMITAKHVNRDVDLSVLHCKRLKVLCQKGTTCCQKVACVTVPGTVSVTLLEGKMFKVCVNCICKFVSLCRFIPSTKISCPPKYSNPDLFNQTDSGNAWFCISISCTNWFVLFILPCSLTQRCVNP